MRAKNKLELDVAAPDARRAGNLPGWSLAAGILLLAALVSVAQDKHPAATAGDGSATLANPIAQAASTSTNPSSAQPMTAQDQRRKQIADESTQLLSMAIALKAEVDKTNKDVLSINVIRKADEIEKLAHTVKQKIKQGAGPG